MSRRKKFVLNTVGGIAQQVVAMICGFLIPRYMLLWYGSSVNGLVTSVLNFLGIISLAEMGIGPVIQANLYTPLAQKNHAEISRIVVASERFFHLIAYFFLAYILVLCFAYPHIAGGEFDAAFTVPLILIIAISTFAQYYFGMTYQLLLNADQSAYVLNALQIVTLVLNAGFCIFLMKLGASVHMVKLATSIIFLIRPIGQSLYVRRHYQIDHRVAIGSDPIKQRWNGFAQHLAGFACGSTDVVVLTIFTDMTVVSVYSVYSSIVMGLTQLMNAFASGVMPLLGNIIANDNRTVLRSRFVLIEFFLHLIITIVFTISILTILPFVQVYTRSITDTSYYYPVFGLLMNLAYAVQCLRIPYVRVISAAGRFRETQNGAIVSMIINVVISILLVRRYGLAGVAAGTLAAMLYHTVYCVWYLKRDILFMPIKHFARLFISDLTVGFVSILLTRNWMFNGGSYISWILFTMKNAIVVVLVSLVFHLLFFRERLTGLVTYLSHHAKESE